MFLFFVCVLTFTTCCYSLSVWSLTGSRKTQRQSRERERERERELLVVVVAPQKVFLLVIAFVVLFLALPGSQRRRQSTYNCSTVFTYRTKTYVRPTNEPHDVPKPIQKINGERERFRFFYSSTYSIHIISSIHYSKPCRRRRHYQRILFLSCCSGPKRINSVK